MPHHVYVSSCNNSIILHTIILLTCSQLLQYGIVQAIGYRRYQVIPPFRISGTICTIAYPSVAAHLACLFGSGFVWPPRWSIQPHIPLRLPILLNSLNIVTSQPTVRRRLIQMQTFNGNQAIKVKTSVHTP